VYNPFLFFYVIIELEIISNFSLFFRKEVDSYVSPKRKNRGAS